MKKTALLLFGLILTIGHLSGQSIPFEKLSFLVGEWTGTGSGFGNDKSKIESSFQFIMNGTYIEVINDSKFEPTESKPEGEHHIDKGFISYDKYRGLIAFRQFHIEGFITQYILNESLSNDSTLVFETEKIENMPEGKARWTINKLSDTEIETIFDVSFTGGEFICFGINKMKKK